MSQKLPSLLGKVAGHAIELRDPVESIYTERWTGLRVVRGGIHIIVKPSPSIDRLEFLYEFSISGDIEVSKGTIENQMENIPVDTTEAELKQEIQEKRYEKIDQDQIKNVEQKIQNMIESANVLINKKYIGEDNGLFNGFVASKLVYPKESNISLKKYDQATIQLRDDVVPILELIYNEIDQLEDGFNEDENEELLERPDHYSYQ